MENNQKYEETALQRYKIISPVLAAIEENADKGKIEMLRADNFIVNLFAGLVAYSFIPKKPSLHLDHNSLAFI